MNSDGGSSPSGVGPHLRLGWRDVGKIAGPLLAGLLALGGWLWSASTTWATDKTEAKASHAHLVYRVDKIEEGDRKRDGDAAEYRKLTQTLVERVTVLVTQEEERRRVQPRGGGPASEPPPAAPVPTPEELRREVEQLLRRLDQRERGGGEKMPEPADAPSEEEPKR